MTVYRLAWQLLVHIAHGRGRDTVHVDIDTDYGPVRSWIDRRDLPVADVNWLDDEDAMLVLTAGVAGVIR